jgi:hypothetical protein
MLRNRREGAGGLRRTGLEGNLTRMSCGERFTFGLAIVLSALAIVWFVYARFIFGIQTDGGGEVVAILAAHSKAGTPQRRLIIPGFLGTPFGFDLWVGYATLAC